MLDKSTSNRNFFRTTALMVLVVGAIGSLVFMFNAGRNQKSIMLLSLFTVWVLSPFAALFIVNKISNRWTVSMRVLLYWLMIILAIGSLVAYSGILLPQDTKNAFIFLVAPMASWILILIFILIARKISKRDNAGKPT